MHLALLFSMNRQKIKEKNNRKNCINIQLNQLTCHLTHFLAKSLEYVTFCNVFTHMYTE